MKGHTYSKRRPFTALFATRRPAKTSPQSLIDQCANRGSEVLALQLAFTSIDKTARVTPNKIRAAARRARRGYVPAKNPAGGLLQVRRN